MAKLSKQDREKIRALWEEPFELPGGPLTIAELARAWNVSTRTIRRIVREEPAPVDADRLLTPREVGVLLRVSAQRIRAMIADGKLAAVNMGTSTRPRWLVPRESVAEYVKRETPQKTTGFRRYRSN